MTSLDLSEPVDPVDPCSVEGCILGRVSWSEAGMCGEHDLAEKIRQGQAELQERLERAREEGRARVAGQPTGDAAIICPHCQTHGQVRSSRKRVKRGVSGGKATGALLTGGLSLLGTGLSRKETVTQMRCGNCGTAWTV